MSLLDARQTGSRTGGPSFSLGNRVQRLAWNIVWLLLASWTPRQAHPWRRLLLRMFGAKVARNTDVRGSAKVWLPANLEMETGAIIGPKVDCYNQAPIFLGRDVLISQRASLCAGTHDIDDPAFQLIARPIRIEADAWIAAEAFVGPGTVVGAGAVLGGRAVAFGTLEPWTVYVGNPARALRRRRIKHDPGASPAIGDSRMSDD